MKKSENVVYKMREMTNIVENVELWVVAEAL